MKLRAVEAAYRRFVRSQLTVDEAVELERVDALATALSSHLDRRRVEIDTVHLPEAQSSRIQSIVEELLAAELGFRNEVVLTPQEGLVTRARPDFVFRLGEGRGVLAEVERGGTTLNNHDLKDFWKTHLAPDAHHLFLVVPHANWNRAGGRRERPFQRVCHRLGGFFGDARREVDVVSLHVFGYGRDELPADWSTVRA